MELLLSKPVLVGLHLGFGIIGIDAFMWALGELMARDYSKIRLRIATTLGLIGFTFSWIVGGFYYVKYYGVIVKPVIKAGVAPWAHAIIMEAKEHIFLFIVPLAFTVFFLAILKKEDFMNLSLRRASIWIAASIVFLGLSIGLMGYIISAAARWG